MDVLRMEIIFLQMRFAPRAAKTMRKLIHITVCVQVCCVFSVVHREVISWLCFGHTGLLFVKVALSTLTPSISPPKHKFRYRQSFNRGLIVQYVCACTHAA